MPKSKNRKGHKEAASKRALQIKEQEASFKKMIEQQIKLQLLRNKIQSEGKIQSADDFKD